MEKCIIDPERDCIGKAKADMLEKQLNEHIQRSRETHSHLYARITALERNDSARDAQYASIMDKLTEMSSRLSEALDTISEIEQKPAKRWDSVVDKILLAVIGAVVAYMLAKLGL